jgi:hypothetical protein
MLSPAASALFALDALLLHVLPDNVAWKLNWATLTAHVRDADARLLRVDDARALFTEEAYIAYIELQRPLPRIDALFEHALADGTLACGARLRALAAHLAKSRRSSRYAHRPCLLPATCEYLDWLLVVDPSARMLVHTRNARIHCCRLMLAISLQHRGALVWLASIIVATKRTPDGRAGMTHTSPDFGYCLIMFAALSGNDRFFDAACRLFPTFLTNVDAPIPYLRYHVSGPCPFEARERCCLHEYTKESYEHARRLLPLGWYQRTRNLGWFRGLPSSRYR